MDWKRSAIAFLLTTILPGVAKAQDTRAAAQPYEQSVFGLEAKVDRQAKMPLDILQILRKEDQVLRCLNGNQSPDQIPATWFLASKIHLDSSEENGLLVQPKNPCLFGANIGPFWVFKKTPAGHSLVLKTDALGLEVLSSRTSGSRDIRGTQATAIKLITVVFRFDGNQYQPSKSEVAPIH
jgi:hypothetical protein